MFRFGRIVVLLLLASALQHLAGAASADSVESLQTVSEATDSLHLTSHHQRLREQVQLNQQLSEELLAPDSGE